MSDLVAHGHLGQNLTETPINMAQLGFRTLALQHKTMVMIDILKV